MDLKQQDEKLYKTYTSCLVSSESRYSLDIDQMKLCLVPDEQLEEGKNLVEQLLNPSGGTGLQQPLTFELKEILQAWLKDFIKKNSRYQQEDLKLYEVIEPDAILSFEQLVITPGITKNLHDLNGGLTGKVVIESIRGKSYFIYESGDHKLFYINPNALISGISGMGFEVNEELSGILKKKINLKKNIRTRPSHGFDFIDGTSMGCIQHSIGHDSHLDHWAFSRRSGGQCLSHEHGRYLRLAEAKADGCCVREHDPDLCPWLNRRAIPARFIHEISRCRRVSDLSGHSDGDPDALHPFPNSGPSSTSC